MVENKIIASIVIPCRNEIKYIGSVIDAILANTSKEIEILVIDGMSDDGTREKLNEIQKTNPKIQVIDNPQRVTPVAFNLGIKNAKGDFVFIVGARHLIESNYIETCIEILNKNPEIGCVGGRVINIYENETSQLISKALASSFAVGAGNFRILKEDSFTDTVGTPVYRKNIFDEIGLFDEELLRNQDDELNFRVLKNGYKILFTVQTSLKYFVRATFAHLSKQFYQYGYWKVYVNKKHRTVTTLRQIVPLLFVLYLFLGAICSFFSPIIFAAYACGLVFYFLVSFISAAKISSSFSEFIQIVRTFFILHFSYGRGYLKGIINFLILGKGVAKDEVLTR
jgi:glycosyltransferase involved in cell wall biosynthesis